MGIKKSELIWMTFLGQTIYENLNPYWWFCEKMNTIPDQIVIFHAIENQSGISKAIQAISIVSKRFNSKHSVRVSDIPFDDENVKDFYNKAEKQFTTASSENNKIFIDVSPTTWSFVPVYLVKLVEKYSDIAKSIGYIQYAEHGSRKSPYPLIPGKGIIVHDFGAQEKLFLQ